MTIYLDIVLFENIILNYIILLSTAIISKAKISTLKIFMSSLIGGIFSILNYIVNIDNICGVILKIGISIIMILITFQDYKLKKFIKELMFFYLTSFTFGGIAFMLLFFISPNNLIMENNHFIGTYPIKIAVLSGGVGFIIITVIAEIIKSNINKKSMICDLEIFYDGKYKKLKTMLDTGNLLKEPISKADVVIVEKDSLEGIISNDILKNIKHILKGKWIESDNIHSYKFKLIPFSSLGNENGLLIGFKPDYIKIYGEEECIRKNVLVAIYDGKLSRTNSYSSLIGLDILNKEERKNEFVKKI